MSKARPCSTCRGVRLHRIRLSVDPAQQGKRVRVLACTVCESETEIPQRERPGISCPRCPNQVFRVLYTRYRPGGTVRVKQCNNPECGHRIRTHEKIESVTA